MTDYFHEASRLLDEELRPDISHDEAQLVVATAGVYAHLASIQQQARVAEVMQQQVEVGRAVQASLAEATPPPATPATRED